MTTTVPEIPVAAEWRQLGRFLWTGRRDGRPIGMIEQGRWFVLTDERGAALGRYRSLADAQTAADDATQRVPLQADGRLGALAARTTGLAVALGGGAALGSIALVALHAA